MIELALLVGLGAVGYMLAKDQPSSTEHYSNGEAEARPTQKIQDEIVHTQQEKGHNNEVPFLGRMLRRACIREPRINFWTITQVQAKSTFKSVRQLRFLTQSLV
jgi:hypothetical protein